MYNIIKQNNVILISGEGVCANPFGPPMQTEAYADLAAAVAAEPMLQAFLRNQKIAQLPYDKKVEVF